MLVINGADYTIFAVGLLGTFLFFIVQLTLCIKAKKMSVKLIPVYIILFCGMPTIADLCGLLGYRGFISMQGILAVVLAIIIGFALVGEAAAWIVYNVHKRKRSGMDARPYRFQNRSN